MSRSYKGHKMVRKLLIYMVLVAGVGLSLALSGSRAAAASPTPSAGVFASATCDYNKTFFGLPVWYEYLKAYERTDAPDGCSFDFNRNDKTKSTTNDVASASALVLVGLAIVDILLRVIGIVAVAFIMVGGFRYVIGQGEPDQIKSAQNTVINALIGLVIALISSGAVAFVGTRLGGG
jgi:hypothetical protein